VKIEFPPKLPGTMRLAAWNVSGLVACEKKVASHFPCFSFSFSFTKLLNALLSQGFKHYLAAEDPDILIITETKVSWRFAKRKNRLPIRCTL
jgi:AP endonuclease-1